ncbi:glycosyltransferase [Nostoc sp. UHCC 0252]|uniref:glycosyltransferase n=1 Tax=Nostoc sp. UHCC 0252 TaxID=3110241 RepID=UPI002B2168F4|nr:glycosyltransferase [Nostoc sp. UHCC 0252]MEA5602300.1 glycosyltransferase [Nostoc sp. UHCC 0252]
MMNLKHIVLTDPDLNGFEYGMLRDFEEEIIRVTSGHPVVMPKRKLPTFIESRIGHGTRYGNLRKFIPKVEYDLKADVLWVILMGPENFPLDLFKNWDRHVGVKILYIFDTFEGQLPSIRRILDSTKWDLAITSFHGALPFLEEQTQHKWYAIPQGVKLDRFKPVAKEEKLISFSAYGRRLQNVHNSIKEYCLQTNKYYEYTTTTGLQPQLDPCENYRQYAWHLAHSFFTFSWPVELTNPKRVLTFSPITCRWFEAAASGTVILGQAPKDPEFEKIFGSDLVIPIDYTNTPENLRLIWEELWENRSSYLQAVVTRREKLGYKWSWENRVKEILQLLNLS